MLKNLSLRLKMFLLVSVQPLHRVSEKVSKQIAQSGVLRLKELWISSTKSVEIIIDVGCAALGVKLSMSTSRGDLKHFRHSCTILLGKLRNFPGHCANIFLSSFHSVDKK